MSDPQHIHDIALIAMLPATDPAAQSARAHCVECSLCAEALSKAEMLGPMLDGGASVSEDPEKTEILLADVRTNIRSQTPALQRWIAPGAVLFTSGLFAAASARAPATELAHAQGAAFVVIAVVAAAMAQRFASRALNTGLLLGIALCLLAGSDSALHMHIGMHCVKAELMASLCVMLAVVLVYRKYAVRPSAVQFAAVALTGAMATGAILHFACPARAGFAHNVIFHGGGMFLAAAIAWLVAKRLRQFPVAVLQ